MKAVPIVGVLLVMVTQTIAFVVLWNWIVANARLYDRFPQEIAFGLTIHYGSIMIVGLFVACGLVAFLTSKPRLRLYSIFTGLFAWAFFLWPALDSRPYALPVFFALGATILIGGTGFGVPYFQGLSARIAASETNGEQNGVDQAATRSQL